MAEAAPATVSGTSGNEGNQSGTGTGQPATTPKADAKAQAQIEAMLRADLGDGEQEYKQSHVLELARRGKKTAQIMSKAEQRAQEALRKEQEAEQRLSRLKSKDWGERRSALKELGWDEIEYAKTIAQEVTEAEALTPEQRRIRELEQQLKAEDTRKSKAQEEEKAKALEADTERHKEEFAALFLDVMQRAGLPRESATAAYYRLASMYQAADAAQAQLDPDVAAERLKHDLRSEHTALFRKRDGSLDLDAFEASLSPEDWKAINKRAVEKYLAGRNGGKAPQRPAQEAAPEAQQAPAKSRPGHFWKELDRRLGR